MNKVKSVKQLMRFCERNGLCSLFPTPCPNDHAMRWKLMYGLIDGDTCRAEFVSRPLGRAIPSAASPGLEVPEGCEGTSK